MQNSHETPPGAPLLADPTARMSLGRIFRRFLYFGFNAWGGPVPQIAMLRKELVEEEGWTDPQRFNRTLALYQALPGPEAHELCVWFGTLKGGRLGGLLAGLGFMLPGFVFMLLLSWLYVAVGLKHPAVGAAFLGVQAAVMALILLALRRIGLHTLHGQNAWIAAGLAFVASLLGVHFLPILVCLGLAYAFQCNGKTVSAAFSLLALVALGLLLRPEALPVTAQAAALTSASLGELFWSGLKAGSLTFGGAYTVIPFLRADAVLTNGWITNAQFLDGIGLSGSLPAPLIIFSTFIGYLARSLAGALVMTAGIFLPAFGFTLLGHDLMDRAIEDSRVRCFLDGVTAVVVGLMASTVVTLLLAGPREILPLLVSIAAGAVLFFWKFKWATPVVMLGAALAGSIIFRP